MAHLDKRVCICYLFKGITEDSVEDDEGAGTYHTPQRTLATTGSYGCSAAICVNDSGGYPA